MVILDKVDNLINYLKYKKIADFLAQNKNRILENGKYEIDENCYVVVSEYNTLEPNGLFEGHLKYVDLQVIIDGEEYVHVQEKDKCELEKAYDESKDAAFYKTETWHTYYLGKGFFVVFDKEDLHRPCVKVWETKKVKKYVFKIRKV